MMHDTEMGPPEPTGVIGKWSRSPLCNMASVYRFSSLPVHHKETVAEHTFYVSTLSLILANDILERGFPVDTGLLLQRCAAHDLDESLTGDIIRPFKHSDPDLHRMLQVAADNAMRNRYATLPGGDVLHDAWREAKCSDTEGQILDFADVWSVYLFMYREVRLGNDFAVEKLRIIQRRVDEHDWETPITVYAFELSHEIGSLLEEVS
jgi:5'-deoxynucleotidase YfbR-like HD superfamily hydrolase